MAEVNSNHIPPPPNATDAPENQDNKDVQMTDADVSQGEQQPNSQPPAPAPVPAPATLPASEPIPAAASDAPSSQATVPDQSQQSQSTQQLQADNGPQAPTSSTPTKPSRTGTPAATNSRAASAHPDPQPKFPSEAAPHGAPVRQYLNSKVTGVLMEGMKKIAKERPKDPLRVLGEYLIQRSKEVEGTS